MNCYNIFLDFAWVICFSLDNISAIVGSEQENKPSEIDTRPRCSTPTLGPEPVNTVSRDIQARQASPPRQASPRGRMTNPRGERSSRVTRASRARGARRPRLLQTSTYNLRKLPPVNYKE